LDKFELIKKLKALSEQGLGGEKINALKKLNDLMKKYNITEKDLAIDTIEDFDFKYGSKNWEKSLLGQVFYSVVGDIFPEKGIYSYLHIKNELCIRCTKADFLETISKFNFYRVHYKKELRLFYKAFIQANHIYPEEKLITKQSDKFFLNEEDEKVLTLSRGLENHIFRKQLEQKGGTLND